MQPLFLLAGDYLLLAGIPLLLLNMLCYLEGIFPPLSSKNGTLQKEN